MAVGPGAKTEEGKIIKMDVRVEIESCLENGLEQVKIDGKEYSIMKELTLWEFQR